MKDIISVVIPIYNVEKYLKDCVDSIINQTYKELEIILVDDGSPDNCGEICDEYAKLDKRIKVIHKKNGGLSDARNKGMSIATGKYIVFIDSDDIASLDMITRMYEKIKNDNSDICVCNVYRITENKKSLQSSVEEDELVDLGKYGVNDYIVNYMLNNDKHRYCAWNRMYRRDLIAANNLIFEPNKEIHSEDLLFNLYCLMYAKKISFVGKPLYEHYIREGTISTSPKPHITDKLTNLAKRYYENALSNNKWSEVENSFPYVFLDLFFMSAYNEVKHNNVSFTEFKQIISSNVKEDIFRNSFSQLVFSSRYSLRFKRKLISLLFALRLDLLGTSIVYKYIKSLN